VNLFVSLLLFILNTFDGISTAIFVSRHGSEVEINPLARFLINQIGIYALIPKIVLGLLICILVYRYWKSEKRFRVIVWCAVGLYSLIAINCLVHFIFFY
jgi:hypothetical protein